MTAVIVRQGKDLIPQFVFGSHQFKTGRAVPCTPAARRLIPVVSYGSSHAHFNTQVSRILERTSAQGHLDCIFIGDSQVIHGIDPAVIEPLLSERLGRTVRCHNFGLGGMTPLTVEPVARMLIARFHPELLVFGTSLMNYIASDMDASHGSILASPWLAYELGEPSPELRKSG